MLEELLKPVLENTYFVKYGMLGLFFNSILAAIIPFPVEITSSALLLNGQNPSTVFSAMAVGSIIGGVISYFIGYDGNKIFNLLHKTKKSHYEKGLALFSKYGWGIICVSSWIPILGDVVTVIAGIKKYDFKKFVIPMSVGRISHAMAIVYFSNFIFHSFTF